MRAIEVRSIRKKTDRQAFDYVVRWIKNPDKGSQFERKTRGLRWLPGSWLVALLQRLSYNGILFFLDDEIIGHIFYQEHDMSVRVFSVQVSPQNRRQGHATRMVAELLKMAHAKNAIKEVRLGVGGSKEMTAIWIKVVESGIGLPFAVKAGSNVGIVEFVRIPLRLAS